MSNNFDHAPIPDSTDWLPTSLPGVAPVESALRCQVCKDFFATPVVTSCAHTFCSLCIRKCLSSDGRCPMCRAPDQDSKLRRNWAVEEVVEAFKHVRSDLLKLSRRKECEDSLGGNRKKRKALEIEEGVRDVSSRQTRSRSRREAVGEEPRPTQPDGVDLEEVEAETEEDGVYQPNDGLVQCPICNKRMKEEAVFAHLDKCSGSREATDEPKSRSHTPAQHSFQNRVQPQQSSSASRIAQLNYSLLNDNNLRKKIQSQGIPAWGPRQLLIRRHTEWVNIFNSNCDSTRPRTKHDLLRDLDTWERSQGGHASTATSYIMKKDFNGQGWAENNKDQFADLIALARRRKAAPAEVQMEKTAELTNSTKMEITTTPSNDRNSTSTAMQQPPNLKHESSVPNISEGIRPESLVRQSIASPTTRKQSLVTVTPESPARKIPMFRLPEQPLTDLDGESSVQ